MRWLADECVAAALVGYLRGAGHDVSYIAESEASASDVVVVSRAHAENCLLGPYGDRLTHRVLGSWYMSAPGDAWRT